MSARVVDRLVLGMWQANCFIVGDRESGRAVVVDPGQDGADPVIARLDALGLTCEAVLLTHGHLDHLWSAPQVAERLDLPVLLHPDDRWLWDDPAAGIGASLANLEAQFGLRWEPPTERLEDIKDGQVLGVADLGLMVRHTPGHTPGSCVFLADDGEAIMVAGDLLFAGSVGRTDFPRGSMAQQNDSLRRVVLPLADETVVHPGHGPDTTVGTERATNPFLRAL
ncbi:MAG: MBL fold metallo-hydrolase [Actinobacteria bacterium]|nr:MBL fold metallo-hydrolase [Actinomycetota bacterium]